MDKNAIKKYAVWARRELLSRVSKKAEQYGITESNIADEYADTVNGHLLTSAEKNQRSALIHRIRQIGYKQTMEEAAYTWFNRFTALRFMEANGYLPSHIRVFTDEQNAFKPQILAEAIHLDMDGLDMDKVYALKNENKTEELYKYLLVTQCNALREALPGMFTRIEDYTELLFPENLLREGSVIEQMIALIPEVDWTDQVQIIGWLYESYNIEKNELVYDGNMSKNRIPKELLPAATTIFTPDWPIRYMVENSLGRLWVEGHPNDNLKSNWKYYLDDAEQEPEMEAQLAEIRKEYATLKPEDIKVIDPCMGSGHILVYMFDVLVQIYESYGYNAREAASLILENNLYGLDIDDRAAQLAYFAVMMKARQYDRRIFSRGIQPHVYAIVESNGIHRDTLDYFENGDANLKKAMETIVYELHDAKEYGSILNTTSVDFAALYNRLGEIIKDISLFASAAQSELCPVIEVAELLTQKYHVVVTNPPYLGSGRFSPKLDDYVKHNYSDVKSDLSMVMLKHMLDSSVAKNGFVAFLTTSSWMFLSSFEKLRKHMFSKFSIDSIVDFGTELFDGKVGHNPIVAWVNRASNIDKKMTAVRLVDYCYSRRHEKESEFFNFSNRYISQQSRFSIIPGSPVAYWVSDKLFDAFAAGTSLKELASPRVGLQTSDNDKYLRYWYECSTDNLFLHCESIEESCGSRRKWYPHNKGGAYRKWYGNYEYVVDYQNNGTNLRNDPKAATIPDDLVFKTGVTFSRLGSGLISFRHQTSGVIFDSAAVVAFPKKDIEKYCLGLLNTKLIASIVSIIAPTMNTQPGDIAKIPIIFDLEKKQKIDDCVSKCISDCTIDWNSFETSWDFMRHPLVRNCTRISSAYDAWTQECNVRFNQLKANEEELNHIFIDIYGVQDELTPEVDEKDVTARKADLGRDIRSLISYAVGCMFGRYSLDCEGLAYAGGDWDESKYISFEADKDNIIPICDDDYFDDDITGRFIKWVETVYGKDTLEENLKFIADALGGKGTPREVIRNYFISGFYADHLKTYQKRPIYWLFDSGKKSGFKALIYMHRYQPDTIARMRTDYVHEQQSRYRTAIEDLENRINGASTSERVKLTKQLQKLKDQAEEIRIYEEKIHHLADMMIPIDLDDGVKVNYAKFADVLAKIK